MIGRKTAKLTVVLLACLWIDLGFAEPSHPLVMFLEYQLKIKDNHIDILKELKNELRGYLDRFGRITPQLQDGIYELEDKYYGQFDEAAKYEFQAMVGEIGGKVRNDLLLPKNQTPFWFNPNGKLGGFRSTKELPEDLFDIAIIGAGLTGSSAAYHLIEAAKLGKKIVILEEGQHPAWQSSGRNGGNFQLLAESYVGPNYDGLVGEREEWLKASKSTPSLVTLKKVAHEQMRTLLKFSFNNFNRFRDIVEREKIDCDLSDQGWLRIAGNVDEERALKQDMEWLQSQEDLRLPKMRFLSSQEIYEMFNLETRFGGRLIENNGNYHPYKFVEALLKIAIDAGVQFYTGIRVQKIQRVHGLSGETITLLTKEGKIQTRKVIVATNAFVSELIPELTNKVYNVPSQMMNLEHVENNLVGTTITKKKGDIYFNFPKSKSYVNEKNQSFGMLHFGLDFHRPETFLRNNYPSEKLFKEMISNTEKDFKHTVGQPPSRIWKGPMGFTDDRVPVIGFFKTKNLIVVVGFQGYGGSYATQAGYLAAQMALTGLPSDEVPEWMFSPHRFKTGLSNL